MNPLNYASLEASQRLVNAGMVLETEAWWSQVPRDNTDGGSTETVWEWKLCNSPTVDPKRSVPAPSMSEIWRELPEYIDEYELRIVKSNDMLLASYMKGRVITLYGCRNTNPTDALIDLLIWVTEQKEKVCIKNLSLYQAK